MKIEKIKIKNNILCKKDIANNKFSLFISKNKYKTLTDYDILIGHEILTDYEALKYSDNIVFELNYEYYIYNDFKYLKDRIKVKGIKYENRKN